MLDIRRIRQNPQELIDALKKRNTTIDLTEIKKPSSNGGNSDSGGDNSGNLGE